MMGLNCSDQESNLKAPPEKNCEREKEDTLRSQGGKGGNGLAVTNWTAGSSAGKAFSWEPYLRNDTYKGCSYGHAKICTFCVIIPLRARFACVIMGFLNQSLLVQI